MLKKLKDLIHNYISIGTNENTSINDFKKIQLLHIFCNTWHLFSLLSIIEDFLRERLSLFVGLFYVIMISLVITVQVLLSFQKTTKAAILFIFNIFIAVLFFSNFIFTGELLEYYFLLPPSIGLIYINNKKINIIISIACLLALFLPNLYFKHYPITVINNMNSFFLFFSFFILVSFFKNLNFRSEKILEAKTKELEELDQFKSQFFTNISHEIRTPLTLINGYISDLEPALTIRKTTGIQYDVKKQIQKITDIVDSVLDLAKMQSSNFNLHLKSTNVSETLRKQFMNFEPLFIQKKIDFNLSTSSIDYYSFIDVVFFEKAINNIIINALKYTETGNVSITCSAENNQLIIKISDTGIGLIKNDLERVFNRFYQVNNDINKSGGSGIGLAFCKEIIELHNGTISLKSKPSEGSKFTITLPLEKKTPTVVIDNNFPIEIVEKTTQTKNTNQNYHFLIVDDNFDMRKYLCTILKGYQCTEAADGIKALEIIAQNKIDFIITDFMMPKLNGYEFVNELNKKNNTTPIVMLTAKTDLSSKLDVLKLGIDDYITKPFNKQELLTRIKNCIKNNTEKESYNTKNNITSETTSKDIFLKQLKDYIFKNSNNTSLNQDIIAEEFNMSKSSFYRKIKSNTGLGPNNFIREIKLQKARSILQNKTNISLKELSFEVGFNHSNYFSKVYENRFGVKPLEEVNH